MTEAQAWNTVVYLVAFVALGFFIRKWINAVENKVSDLCETVSGKVPQKFCDDYKKANEKEHEDIWKRVHHHKHSEGGEVVISR